MLRSSINVSFRKDKSRNETNKYRVRFMPQTDCMKRPALIFMLKFKRERMRLN